MNDLLTRLDRNRATRNVDPILAQKFKEELDRIKEHRTLETWLRVAVWWLIKVVLIYPDIHLLLKRIRPAQYPRHWLKSNFLHHDSYHHLSFQPGNAL